MSKLAWSLIASSAVGAAAQNPVRQQEIRERRLEVSVPSDGGTGKGGQKGREKGASTAVTLWPTLEVTMPVTSEGEISGGRILQRFRLLRTIGLAFDLQDDRSLYQAVEERHCQ